MPPGDRKSGMPDSVEMPAPVNATMRLAALIISRRRSVSSMVLSCHTIMARAWPDCAPGTDTSRLGQPALAPLVMPGVVVRLSQPALVEPEVEFLDIRVVAQLGGRAFEYDA